VSAIDGPRQFARETIRVTRNAADLKALVPAFHRMLHMGPGFVGDCPCSRDGKVACDIHAAFIAGVVMGVKADALEDEELMAAVIVPLALSIARTAAGIAPEDDEGDVKWN
jgi:hypothetical protein